MKIALWTKRQTFKVEIKIPLLVFYIFNAIRQESTNERSELIFTDSTSIFGTIIVYIRINRRLMIWSNNEIKISRRFCRFSCAVHRLLVKPYATSIRLSCATSSPRGIVAIKADEYSYVGKKSATR